MPTGRCLVIDECLPSRLAVELVDRGRVAQSAKFLGLEGWEDQDVISHLAQLMPDCILVTADDNLPSTHKARLDQTGLTVATINSHRAATWDSDGPWRREVVHRWAHKMAEQPQGSRRRYGLTPQKWVARKRKSRK